MMVSTQSSSEVGVCRFWTTIWSGQPPIGRLLFETRGRRTIAPGRLLHINTSSIMHFRILKSSRTLANLKSTAETNGSFYARMMSRSRALSWTLHIGPCARSPFYPLRTISTERNEIASKIQRPTSFRPTQQLVSAAT